ncbi:MAG TPA: glycoside hydrolase family 9 protein [Verrucomicrobiae bacterium]|nr:glycoside hydrolase family 9 protein [Verrucomicrobiae bacterium]
MRTPFRLLVFLCGILAVQAAFGQNIKILVNHIGYEQFAPKRAVILGHPGDSVTDFKLIDSSTGREALSGTTVDVGPVDHWKDWRFWTADFSSITNQGAYLLECATSRGVVRSFPFQIQRDLLERNTLSSIIYYFKGQRCSGLLDKADRHLKFEDGAGDVDAHGGWYDATGDYGKHIGGLSFSTYFNMQPLPVAAWSLFSAYNELDRRGDPSFRQFKRRLLDEAMYGADFLVRMKSPTGSFYRTVDGPGPEKRPEDRRIGKEGVGFAIKTAATKKNFSIGNTNKISGKFPYEVGWRSGGGVSIAVLAMASTFPVCGQFSNAVYLQTAKDAFAFLEKNNLAFNSDGNENILDDYCALLASTELFKATKAAEYRAAADQRAENLMRRLVVSGEYSNYWRADDGDRPYFHAADAGMPVIALLDYLDIAGETAHPRILETVRKSLEFELAITEEVVNPFGYARQLVQSANGFHRTAFFYPHDTETAPWWQGENARLSSMAAAARLASKYFKDDTVFYNQLQAYAWNQLNWILGLNPYDCCMMQSAGRNNVAYMFFDSYEYNNAPGGICNGITGGRLDPHDVDFNVGFAVTGKDEDWRWSEQWLPHATWYLYAVSVGN